MPLNIPGILVPFHLLINPRLIVPGLIVKDIRQLDFLALRRAGYRGAVFDKDNCLTIPHRDTLVPELQEAWKQCRETFGEGNVLIVSNSAGSHLDAGCIQAESVKHHLNVPVLLHSSPKPGYSCIAAIRRYFASLPSPIPDDALIIVGDRLFTDVTMANRMRRRTNFWERPVIPESGPLVAEASAGEKTPKHNGPLSIWTTSVWEREAMAMRWGEKKLLDTVQRWTRAPPIGDGEWDVSSAVKELPPDPPKPPGRLESILAKFRLGKS